MKRILALLSVALLAFNVSAATLVPIQLLNPAGSTSGQVIVSTGPSTAPGFANVPAANVSGLGTAATQNTGTSGANVPLLNGANTWASAQTFSALISPTSTIGIKGTATNDSTAAGSVGEYATASTGLTSISSSTGTNIASVSLTAGDWDVSGVGVFVAANTTVISSLISSISTTSGTSQSTLTGQTSQENVTFPTIGSTNTVLSPTVRISIASTTTVFLVGTANFSTSTMTAAGIIRARRVR